MKATRLMSSRHAASYAMPESLRDMDTTGVIERASACCALLVDKSASVIIAAIDATLLMLLCALSAAI